MKARMISGLNEIIQHYDGFLIDMWGVVHDGVSPYPGAIECLAQLRQHNKALIFMSNMPRPGTLILDKLASFGLQGDNFAALSSGDMVRQQLLNPRDAVFLSLGKNFYHLGSEKNQDILQGTGRKAKIVLQEADYILLTAFLDQDESPEHHDEILRQGRILNLPMVCANPDMSVRYGLVERLCAGFLAKRYEDLGGTVHYYGKPHPAIYTEARAQLALKGIENKARILMIGDTLETDIQGASRAGIHSLLVQTGNMAGFSMSVLEGLCATLGLNPNYRMASLHWA